MSARIAAVNISPDISPATPTLGDLLGYSVNNVPDDQQTIKETTKIQSPVSPSVLSFRNLSYSVNEKNLLNDISGDARQGEILAVLGPSGSGKSTLLDALANRISKGSLKGMVTLNGENFESSLLKVISAYVMQDDLLFPMLTVEETLMFASEFRLPKTLSRSEKKKKVHDLLEQLGLTDVAKTIIGDEGHRGVSGGERRRVSIGMGIVHDPILLFLDEPTSALDSTSTYMVVNVLKRIAQGGRIVMMSIHQPSYRVLNLLDRLLVLSRGQTVYDGSPTSLPFFMVDYGLPVPEEENPIEFLLDIVLDLEFSPEGTRSLVEYNKSRKTSEGIEETPSFSSLKEKRPARIASFANPFWIEVSILVKRSFVNSWRMPEILGLRLFVVFITSVIFAALFWRPDESPKGIQERISFFALALCLVYETCADAIPAFLHERQVLNRETAYNSYRLSSYVISHTFVITPSLVLQSLVLTAITFWALGLEGGISGVSFYFLTILASFWTGTSFVTFVTDVIPNLLLSYAVVIATICYLSLVCGFYISRTRIQPYWIWLHYISFLKYTFEALMQNEFQDTGRCYVRGVKIFDNTMVSEYSKDVKENLLHALSGVLGMNVTSSTCITTGEDTLMNQGITQLSKWSCLWVILGWGVLFRVLFYFSLLVGSKNKRR